MTIVLDAMGSDEHPDPEIQAAVQMAREGGEEIILTGNEEILKPRLQAAGGSNLPIRIVHAPEVLEMEDKPVENARRKSQNSMAIGLDLLKTGEAQAFVTAGNTGGAMVNALFRLGRMKGVLRPALAAIFPVKNGRCVVSDIGANADCKPDFLLQFAIMASIYAEKVMGVANPRVGLLSNGEEPGKGNLLVKETYPLLVSSGLNFIGNVEAKELFGGQADVVVTDGFSGNILLKSSEASAKLLIDILRQEISASTRAKLGYLLAKPAFSKLKKTMDPSEVGAAPLLGVNGLVFIGHGRSDSKAIINAVKLARQAVKANLLDAMSQAIQDRLAQTTVERTVGQ